MKDLLRQSQKRAVFDPIPMQQKGPILRPGHRLHDGPRLTLRLHHEADQSLVGSQVEGGGMGMWSSSNSITSCESRKWTIAR